MGNMALLLKILVLGTSQQFQRALHATQVLAGHVQIPGGRAQAVWPIRRWIIGKGTPASIK